MRLAICVLLMTGVATQAAIAQTCPPPAAPAIAPPILHLAETATIKVAPSLLVADLVASADAPIAVTTGHRQLRLSVRSLRRDRTPTHALSLHAIS